MPTVPLTKKQLERLSLDAFIDLYSDFPAGEIEDSEEPDFLIHDPNGTVGIELTTLFRETPSGERPMQANEASRRQVVERAQAIYTSSGASIVRVSILFNHSHEIQKAEIDGLAQAIADFVKLKMPKMGSTYDEEYEWTNRDYFPEQISHMSIVRLPGITETSFGSSGATWLPTLSREDIARTISGKEVKVESYRLKCREIWLLIDTNSVDFISTWFKVGTEAMATPIVTKFDRIFVVSRFEKQCYEVKVSRGEV